MNPLEVMAILVLLFAAASAQTLSCSMTCSPAPDDTSEAVGNNSRTCDALNGTCLYGCNYGFAAYDCNFTCPEYCGAPKELYNTETCDSNTTYCLHGCEAGYAGDNCSVKCPSNCDEPPEADSTAVCNASTKHCAFGCKDGFYGPQCLLNCANAVLYCAVCHAGSDSNPVCSRCINNFYLNNSQCKSCPFWCAERGAQFCDPDNGECTHGCNNGKYGHFCDKYCSSKCTSSVCDQLTEDKEVLEHTPLPDSLTIKRVRGIAPHYNCTMF